MEQRQEAPRSRGSWCWRRLVDITGDSTFSSERCQTSESATSAQRWKRVYLHYDADTATLSYGRDKPPRRAQAVFCIAAERVDSVLNTKRTLGDAWFDSEVDTDAAQLSASHSVTGALSQWWSRRQQRKALGEVLVVRCVDEHGSLFELHIATLDYHEGPEWYALFTALASGRWRATVKQQHCAGVDTVTTLADRKRKGLSSSMEESMCARKKHSMMVMSPVARALPESVPVESVPMPAVPTMPAELVPEFEEQLPTPIVAPPAALALPQANVHQMLELHDHATFFLEVVRVERVLQNATVCWNTMDTTDSTSTEHMQALVRLSYDALLTVEAVLEVFEELNDATPLPSSSSISCDELVMKENAVVEKAQQDIAEAHRALVADVNSLKPEECEHAMRAVTETLAAVRGSYRCFAVAGL